MFVDDKKNLVDEKYVEEIEIQSLDNRGNKIQKRVLAIKKDIFSKMIKPTSLCINIKKGKFITDKNLLTKMNPYCVIEIGHSLKFKTEISKHGGKNPTWN